MQKNKLSLYKFTFLIIVELEVHRGTVSAIRRKERGYDDDADSVISEDLREFDDEYKLVWEKKPGKVEIMLRDVY